METFTSNDFLNFCIPLATDIIEQRKLSKLKIAEVYPQIQPGFLENVIGTTIPDKPMDLVDLWDVYEQKIFPRLGKTYHPLYSGISSASTDNANTYSEMLSMGISGDAFAWTMSPTMTELEDVFLNILGRLIGLPDSFLRDGSSVGAGHLCPSEEDCFYTVYLAARKRFFEKHRPMVEDEHVALQKLTIYASTNAHIGVHKVCQMESVRLILVGDNLGYIPAKELADMISSDMQLGFYPLMIVTMLGGLLTFCSDDLIPIKNLEKGEHTWIHVDGTYGGVCTCFPDYAYLKDSLQYADSIAIGYHNFFPFLYDCVALYVANFKKFTSTFELELAPTEHTDNPEKINYKYCGITESHRFGGLKLYWVCYLHAASDFTSDVNFILKGREIFSLLVRESHHIKVVYEEFNIIYIRLRKESDEVNRAFYHHISIHDPKAHCTPIMFNGDFCLRIAFNNTNLEVYFIYDLAETIKNSAQDFKIDKIRRGAFKRMIKDRSTDFD